MHIFFAITLKESWLAHFLHNGEESDFKVRNICDVLHVWREKSALLISLAKNVAVIAS